MVATAACDIDDTQHDQDVSGRPVTVLGTSLDATGTVAADGVIQIAFDRYLLPSTITRQSYVFLDNANVVLPATAFQTIYDPVARTVSITGPGGPGKNWLSADQSYKLQLLVASDPTNDIGGFRALDRAPLRRDQKLEFTFRATLSAQEEFEKPMDFCADVLPLFVSKCSGATCHGADASVPMRAAASLILNSAEGVRITAKGRVAQGSNVGGLAYSPLEPGRLFGTNMAVIEPGDPGSSWLMYKIEMARLPVDATVQPYQVQCSPPEGIAIPAPAPRFDSLAPARPADEAERSLLADYVLGREMPYPASPELYVGQSAYRYTALTFDERQKIRAWIRQGAVTKDCGGCGIVQ